MHTTVIYVSVHFNESHLKYTDHVVVLSEAVIQREQLVLRRHRLI